MENIEYKIMQQGEPYICNIHWEKGEFVLKGENGEVRINDLEFIQELLKLMKK